MLPYCPSAWAATHALAAGPFHQLASTDLIEIEIEIEIEWMNG